MEHPPGRKRTAQTPFRTFGLHRLPLLVQPTDTAVNDPPPHTPERWAGPWLLPVCLCWSWDWQPRAHSASGLWVLADGCRAWVLGVAAAVLGKGPGGAWLPKPWLGLSLSSEGYCFCSERGFGDLTCLQSLGEIRECWQESSPSAEEVSEARF